MIVLGGEIGSTGCFSPELHVAVGRNAPLYNSTKTLIADNTFAMAA